MAGRRNAPRAAQDLLAPDSVEELESMRIHEDLARGLSLPDATEARGLQAPSAGERTERTSMQVPLHNLMDVFGVLRTGARNRRTAETSNAIHAPACVPSHRSDCVHACVHTCVCAGANRTSSRSHAIFLVTIQHIVNEESATVASAALRIKSHSHILPSPPPARDAHVATVFRRLGRL